MAYCPVADCTNAHAAGMLMCRAHWFSVPKLLRDELWRAYRSDEGILGEWYQGAREACIAAAEGR